MKLSEYHTGYRAFSRKVLTELPLLENSDDFVFDNQMLAQCVHFGFRIGEVSCPTKYFEEASSINFRRSVKYGFGVLATTLQFALQRAGLIHLPRFSDKGRKLEPGYPTYYARKTDRAPRLRQVFAELLGECRFRSYFFFDRNPSTLLANSSENPNRALARE